ncbi:MULTISPECIES: amino acid ABC transporter permease [Pseudonocardia]|uniref:Amino acid ABC transporter membrane protein 2, PAAT family n=1 Tax=Pseudonocardia oroxyli TaxID=366584 RepID=A0A1G7JYS0_PSEOR|nr:MULTISPECIES: amino acid ABC transporter permease [Pseudonocardia]MCF7550018.1 amino acid ABC transporter permease [Pseudonocardia sp. WMMC193]SDF30083.1 amino acid ABC transporter membrane protein 2, PAAT family [Pseudonocardia oroxyli]
MTSVLYDAPGPKARTRTLISSIVAGVIVLGVVVFVIVRLANQGQFTAAKWGPLLDPTNGDFGPVWNLFGQALVATLSAAGLTLVFSLVIGTLLAVTRVTANRYYRWLVVGVIEFLRGVPVVIAIFFAARVLPQVGIDLPIMWYLVIGLTLYNCVIIAEIVRAGINALPRGQAEAGYSLGLTQGQVLRSILLPQAFRIMLPALISQLVVIVKDTSLGFIISYEEFVRTANIIIQTLQNPIQTYVVVAAIFILINYSLGKLAEYVERRLSRGRKTAAAPADAEQEADAAVGAVTGG